MLNESLKIKGHLNVKLYDEKGNLKNEVDKDNVITTVGKTYLANWLTAATQSTAFMQYMGLGTGTSAASASDTALETPLATRVAGTLTNSTNTWQNQTTFAPGINTGAVSEAGLFSASTGGTMMARQTFATINKLAGDTIVFTWTITLS